MKLGNCGLFVFLLMIHIKALEKEEQNVKIILQDENTRVNNPVSGFRKPSENSHCWHTSVKEPTGILLDCLFHYISPLQLLIQVQSAV